MIEELALVLDASGTDMVRVRTQRHTACESCQMKSGCGQQALVKLTPGKSSLEWSIRNTLDARAGDVVVLQIPETGILGASFLLYLVPLLCMVLAAAAASLGGVTSEGTLTLAALSGLAAGIWFARKQALTRSDNPDYQPRMARFASRQCPTSA
jgi:sigma-E factor negative regulatory protein RseC